MRKKNPLTKGQRAQARAFTAEALQRALEVAEVTQAELARLSGVHPRTVTNIITGATSPRMETLQDIAHALGRETIDFVPRLKKTVIRGVRRGAH